MIPKCCLRRAYGVRSSFILTTRRMPLRTVQGTQLLYLQYATSDASPMQMRNNSCSHVPHLIQLCNLGCCLPLAVQLDAVGGHVLPQRGEQCISVNSWDLPCKLLLRLFLLPPQLHRGLHALCSPRLPLREVLCSLRLFAHVLGADWLVWHLGALDSDSRGRGARPVCSSSTRSLRRCCVSCRLCRERPCIWDLRCARWRCAASVPPWLRWPRLWSRASRRQEGPWASAA
jgi:hypothetical protein